MCSLSIYYLNQIFARITSISAINIIRRKMSGECKIITGQEVHYIFIKNSWSKLKMYIYFLKIVGQNSKSTNQLKHNC